MPETIALFRKFLSLLKSITVSFTFSFICNKQFTISSSCDVMEINLVASSLADCPQNCLWWSLSFSFRKWIAALAFVDNETNLLSKRDLMLSSSCKTMYGTTMIGEP